MEEVAREADRLVVLAGGKIAISGTPAEVFSQGEKLEDMRLEVPEITKIFMELRRLGVPVPQSVYTLKHAKEILLNWKGGLGHA